MNDALDELLSHAKVTLKHLEALRAQQMNNHPSVPSGSQKVQPSQKKDVKPNEARSDPRSRPGFWKPQCDAHLWRGTTIDDLLNGSDDDGDSLASSEDEDEGDNTNWNFLPRAHGYGRFSATTPRQPTEVPPRPNQSRSATSNVKPASSSSEGVGQKQPPKPEVPPKEGSARSSNGATRSDAAGGFRFGGFPDAKQQQAGGKPGPSKLPESSLAPKVQKGPEADVTATLEASLSLGGIDAARQTLRRLLLRWHPDKAPKGANGEIDEVSQAEATRVLRHVLQERERLGL